MCIASRDVVWMSLDHPQALWVRRFYADVQTMEWRGFKFVSSASLASPKRVEVASKDGDSKKVIVCPLSGTTFKHAHLLRLLSKTVLKRGHSNMLTRSKKLSSTGTRRRCMTIECAWVILIMRRSPMQSQQLER